MLLSSMKCDICGFETNNRESFAGHRSGHVRRGELPKSEKKSGGNGERKCPVCGKVCSSGYALGGHLRMHNITFDQLRSEGAKKARLLTERGHRCEVCGLGEWMEKEIPLHLDHQDGNPQNNAKDNLRLICPNCHAQTETYCGRNIGRPKCKRREKAKYPSYRSKDYIEENAKQTSGRH